MRKTILMLPGDGIGPEIMQVAKKIFAWLNQHYPYDFVIEEAAIGGDAIDRYGISLPITTLKMAEAADSILLGAVGGPKWEKNAADARPEKGLLDLRKHLSLYANLRPINFFKALSDSSPIKAVNIKKYDLDMMIVRELTGGIYFGEPRGFDNDQGNISAFNTMRYSEAEIKRVAHIAFNLARKRKMKICSIDKANVLETSMLWRTTVDKIHSQFHCDIELNHMLVDNAAMQLIRAPEQFDVILTENLFGDILSDEASMLTGSIGLLPSASLGDKFSLYEPIHGSAPDIAGKNIANPIAMILSIAMMLSYTFFLNTEADVIKAAVINVLNKGYRTKDIWSEGCHLVSTDKMGDVIIEEMSNAK